MEKENGGVLSEGVLIPVPESSGLFEKAILAPLHSSYLYEESKQFFQYKSAVLVKNPQLEEKYNAFREKRKQAGYSEEDLKESYGFLLFDDIDKANALGITGVLTGNSTCTTLGDPSKGVYISIYSDCLDSNCWYHGKSGYIAIIRLTKGKVNKVVEIYTQNFTTPSEGFDCHVSEQLPSVSSETSSFLAFERTQYYIYERLNDGSNETAKSPSAAFPFAIVSFSYTDSKATVVVPQEKSEVKKTVCPYLPWKGKLQIGSQFYSVGLRSTAGASMPSKLPPVMKINRVISMVYLRHLLPKAAFETCFTGEVFLDGLYCSLCELFSTEVEESNNLAQLIGEIKKNEAALIFPLNDGGFLILMHSSHFLGHEDTACGPREGLRGIFVFPDSRVAVSDVKFAHRSSAISLEKNWFLSALRSAEGEVGKPAIDSSEQLWDKSLQYLRNYELSLVPGLESGPSREVDTFPDQYDEQDNDKNPSLCPEWSERAWQTFGSYLSKPASFQLPLSKASEILAAEQEEQREDLDDDVYICHSSPEMGSPLSNVLEEQMSDRTCVETSVDDFVSRAEAQSDSPPAPEKLAQDNVQGGYAAKDKRQSAIHTDLRKTDDAVGEQLIPLSDDLPSELIVSITSAEKSVNGDSTSVDRNMSTTKHNDFQFDGMSVSAKLQRLETNSHSNETDEPGNFMAYPLVIKLIKTKKRKGWRGRPKKQTAVSPVVTSSSSQTTIKLGEVDGLSNRTDKTAKDVSGNPQQSIPSNAPRRRVIRRKHAAAEKPSDPEQQSLENSTSVEHKAGPLRKKVELWDLKPVITECGRILVPHGSLDVAHHIHHIQEAIQATKDELGLDQLLLDASAKAHHTVEVEKEACADKETSVDEKGVTTSMDCINHQENINSRVNPEENISDKSDNCTASKPLNAEADVELQNKDENAPSQALVEKPIDSIPTEKDSPKGEKLLSKLKSVLQRGKRKLGYVMAEEATQGMKSRRKKRKAKSETEMLTRNCESTPVESQSVSEISDMLPVDIFAHALGLTPKETPVNLQRTEDQENSQKEYSPEMQKIIFSNSKVLRRPQLSSSRRRRIKTLKKQQGISEECIKEKWWLHFQSPTCNASENLAYKDCSRDNVFMKTIKENVNNVCTSSDGLNLLADLALGANSGQVLRQPHPAFERQPESSLKKCDLTKTIASIDQESILHTLLRQPAVRAAQQTHASTSISPLMGGGELVCLLMKEHCYSLAPSSSLLLGLPGAPFQASPGSSSTRLLLHHQTVHGDKNKTRHSCVGQEDQCEATKTPEYLRKLLTPRQKFRQSRTFVYKDGSLQVTRQWPEKYNFESDSKLTTEMKSKAIIRALHGPWDFSIRDTDTEMRLIIHMWIGLFYSRSTARFFHVDSNFSSTEDPSDIPSAVKSDEEKGDLRDSSLTDTSDRFTPEALDLSKNCESASDNSSVILDLSLKSSIAETVTSDPQVSEKETLESNEREEAIQALNEQKSPGELDESQQEFDQSTEKSSEVIDVNDLPGDGEKENLSFCKTVIPFIGPDISGDDTTEPDDCLRQSSVEDVVQGKEETADINQTTNSEAIAPSAVLGTSEIWVEKAERSSSNLPRHDVSGAHQPVGGEYQPENRCPTPTVDEGPHDSMPLGSINANAVLENISQMPSSASDGESPEERTLCDSSAARTHPSSHSGLHDDLETRTLRVLQSVNNLLSKANHTNTPTQIDLTDTKKSPDQTSDSISSNTQSLTALKDSNKRKEEKPVMTCATQDLHAESSHPGSSFQHKLEQILCVNLQIKKTDLSAPQPSPITNEKLDTSVMTDICNSSTSVLSGCLRVDKSHVNQEINQAKSQCHSKDEPAMAGKSSEDPEMEKSSQDKLTGTPVITCTNPTSMHLKNTEKASLSGNSKHLKRKHKINRLSSTDSWNRNHKHSKLNSKKAKLELPYPAFLPFSCSDIDEPNVGKVTSSPRARSSFKSEGSPNRIYEDQDDLRYPHSFEEYEQELHETANAEQAECSGQSAPIVTRSDDGIIDENLTPGPNTSLICTILNTNRTPSASFLEQLSKRCLQVDPTQASVEQAYLIFSDKMKQLVKKSKRRSTQDAHNNFRAFCSSPVTVHLSNLEEREILLCQLDTSLTGGTVVVGMSDRKKLQDQNTEHPQEIPHTAASNPLEHAGVSHMTAESARLYKAEMNGICGVQTDRSRSKCFKMEGDRPKTEPSNHFDFCDQMKREMDEKFRSQLNSVVKRSCKTRYRFFILLTSDDIFFDQTKALLEAEGHTAVDPAQFFDDSLTSLLIIIRNEDIAEYIFQVPRLLELKKSPNVLFAGIDEPDDVINLTYQEVFTGGGIVMIDKTALESLSLCNMKKISTILQELNGMGKWKWMLHYRDSRRIKENARLSTEAKEKKNFLLWGQENGILEVLPYHECDLLTREQPNYLTCLIRLQIQNISSRHTFFITDNATDSAYERKGILTMTMNSFLTKSPSETLTV